MASKQATQAKVVPMPKSKDAGENQPHNPGECIQEIAASFETLRDGLTQGLTTEEIDQRVIGTAQLIGKRSLYLKEDMGSPRATELVMEPAIKVLLDLVEEHQYMTFYTPAEVQAEIEHNTVPFDLEMEALNDRLNELCSITDLTAFRAVLPDLLQGLFEKGITRPIWDGDEADNLTEKAWEKVQKDYKAIVDGGIDRIVAADPCKIGERRLWEIIKAKKDEYVEAQQAQQLKRTPGTLAEVLNRCENKKTTTRHTAAMAAEFAAEHYVFFRTTDKCGYAAMDVAGDGKRVCVHIDLNPVSAFWIELSRAGCLPDISAHRAVARAILFEALRSGNRVVSRTWLDSSSDGSIFLHPHDGQDRVWRVYSGGVEAVPNGTNAQKVFVTTSPLMSEPIPVDPSISIQSAKQGIQLFRDLLVRTAACSPANQNLLAAWNLSSLVRRRYSTRAQIAGHGEQNQGKTAAPTRYNKLSYGDRQIADMTAAAAHVLRSLEPIIYGDDEEEQDLSEQEKRSHRRASTGAERVMRDSSSVDGLVIQPAQNLRWTNAITPMDNNPDRSRTLVVLFDVKRWGQHDHDDGEVRREIVAKRGLIWSAILQLAAHEMLPRLNDAKEQKRVRDLLRERLKDHPKDRLLDHLVVMHTALASLNAWVNVCGDVDQEVLTWIENQAAIEKATATETDDIVANLTLLGQKLVGKPPQDLQGWQVKQWIFEQKKGLEDRRAVGWTATSRQLEIMIMKARKEAGIVGKPPFKNAGSLGSRLGNSVKAGTFKDAGWSVVPPDKDETSAKRVWTVIPPREVVGDEVDISKVLAAAELIRWRGKDKSLNTRKKKPMAKVQGRGKGGRVATKVVRKKAKNNNR